MKSNQAKFCQFSMFNTLTGIPVRTLNWLVGTWAFYFRLFIFPLIKPDMFDCLYSNVYSRPATPPQVLVSMLVIQAYFSKTDDEMHAWMMSGGIDIRFATGMDGRTLDDVYTSDKALSNFRERNRQYAKEHDGYNPLDECLRELQFGMWALMGVSLDRTRIDSTMVSANIARLTREALVYLANASMVSVLKDEGGENMIKKLNEAGLDHYLNEYDSNVVLYSSGMTREPKRSLLAREADLILGLCTPEQLASEKGTVYQQVLSQQTVVSGKKRRFATSVDGTMNSMCIQSLVDLNATFRCKAGKEYIGYILNFVEAVGTEGSQIVSWDFDQNVKSDPVLAMAFFKDAEAILEGIDKYNRLFGIENPGDMKKCMGVLRSKAAKVVGQLKEARAAGRTIPRACDFGVTCGESSIPDCEDNSEQMSLEDLLSGMKLLEWKLPGTESAANRIPTEKPSGEEKTPTVDELAYEANHSGSTQTPPMTSSTASAAQASPEIPSSSADSANQGTSEESQDKPLHQLIIVGKDAFIDNIPLEEYMKKSEFAQLDDRIRQDAIAWKIRSMLDTSEVLDFTGKRIAVTDGAYGTKELKETASKAGFILLPTDLTGKKGNQIIGLFDVNRPGETPEVKHCPMGHVPDTPTPCKTGAVRVLMASEHCGHCPFRNDCNAKEQKRAGNYVVFVSPNAKERIITKALVRSEDYKDICRFRNGVETIPNIVRNHMGIDKLPIGMKIKQTYVAVDMAAVHFGKFSMGRAHIRDHPILRSFG